MISLRTYISESIDVDNLFWKIETYFDRNNKRNVKRKHQYDLFANLVKKCANVGTVTDEEINEFLEKSKLNLKNFIDFLSEDVTTENIDYMYSFKKVIENIISDKSENNYIS